MSRTALLLALVWVVVPLPLIAQASSPDPDAHRPIDALDTVWMEDMTWMEVRDALRAGKTTAIIPTGGIEQNGPYLVTGKHNVIVRSTAERIARMLGNALVAPVIPFVPEGEIEPPSGHMRYPGTISVTEGTFRSLLADVASSLRAHGFRTIVLIGDSGGNQAGMEAVADSLSRAWTEGVTSIHFIPEYYDNAGAGRWLEARGVHEVDQGLHDDVRHSSIMMSVDPRSIRMEERLERGLFSINGVELAPPERTIELGSALADHQAEVTARAIRAAIGG